LELEIWSDYLDFLFEMRELKKGKGTDKDTKFLVADMTFTEPKAILSKALQALPKSNHVNIISKFGMLEFKHGNQESGRTMFEGIVNNYPKRMDIWSIYMDMEIKYGGKENAQQARHLFERCLANEFIQKKPKKMKLVFRKYMEYENALGNQKNIDKLRQRVEEYLEKAFNKGEADSSDEDQNEEKMPVQTKETKNVVEESSEDVVMESADDDKVDDESDDDSMMEGIDDEEEGEDEDDESGEDLMDEDESSA